MPPVGAPPPAGAATLKWSTLGTFGHLWPDRDDTSRTAVAAELRRQELEARADEYVAELIAEVGEPSQADIDRADEIARRLQDRALAAQAG